MTLVVAGVMSHAPGITGREAMEHDGLKEPYYAACDKFRDHMMAQKPDALVLVSAEHFGNFFMDKMPTFCIGLADDYGGPIETEEFLGMPKVTIPGAPELSRRIADDVMQDVDLGYSKEWLFDHGFMVPLKFLTPDWDLPVIPINVNCQVPPLAPLKRCYALGQALRRAIDAQPERIALVGCGGISHWPATPNSGKINEAWDRAFLDEFCGGRVDDMLRYTDDEIYRDAGPGGHEVRTFITVSGAVGGNHGDLWHYAPIPIFAVGCTVVNMDLAA